MSNGQAGVLVTRDEIFLRHPDRPTRRKRRRRRRENAAEYSTRFRARDVSAFREPLERAFVVIVIERYRISPREGRRVSAREPNVTILRTSFTKRFAARTCGSCGSRGSRDERDNINTNLHERVGKCAYASFKL